MDRREPGKEYNSNPGRAPETKGKSLYSHGSCPGMRNIQAEGKKRGAVIDFKGSEIFRTIQWSQFFDQELNAK